MYSHLTTFITSTFSKSMATKNAYQRIKHYSRLPNLYKQITLIRPPDLTAATVRAYRGSGEVRKMEAKKQASPLTFPIHIPILTRHIYSPRPPIFLNTTDKVHWGRLSPNQVLLAMEKWEKFNAREIIEGLEALMKVGKNEYGLVDGYRQKTSEGNSSNQINYHQTGDPLSPTTTDPPLPFNWNLHPWIQPALRFLTVNFNQVPLNYRLRLYHVVRALGYQDDEVWTQLYAWMEERIYDLDKQVFEELFMRYFPALTGLKEVRGGVRLGYKVGEHYKGEGEQQANKTSQQQINQTKSDNKTEPITQKPTQQTSLSKSTKLPCFSAKFASNIFTLMQNRLRSFKGSNIIEIAYFIDNLKLLSGYWLQNVFLSLWKDRKYVLAAKDIAKILRFLMAKGHQNNARFYDAFYQRISNLNLKVAQIDQVLVLKDALDEATALFPSHNIDSQIEYIEKEIARLEQERAKNKKALADMVKQDLAYFIRMKGLKEQKAANL